MKRKIVSFSLYGDGDGYLTAAIRNARQVDKMVGWRARFYVADDVPAATVNALIEADCEIVRKGSNVDRSASYWRYLPIADPDVERCIVADVKVPVGVFLDTLLAAWIRSDRDFVIFSHVAMTKALNEQMRAIWGATAPIREAHVGYMGFRGGMVPDIETRLAEFLDGREVVCRFDDTDFVNEVLLPADPDRIFVADLAKVPYPGSPVALRGCLGPRLADLASGRGPRDLPTGQAGGATPGEVRKRAICLGASGCRGPCERFTKSPAKGWALSVCVDIETGERISLTELWRDRDGHCPKGAF